MQNRYDVGLNQTPVFRDGVTSGLSYAFLACKASDEYNGVVYGYNRTLKFYPNAAFWGITNSILQGIHPTPKGLYNRGFYQGVHGCPPSVVEVLLERIRTQRGATVVSPEEFSCFKEYAGSNREKSRGLHPQTHGVPEPSMMPAFNGPRVTA